MPEDHSQSYKGLGLRAISHRARLNAILRQLYLMGPMPGTSYCDLGCSNGFITEQIRSKFSLNATGMDHSIEHFVLGRQKYPEINFCHVDLNRLYEGDERFDLVTCFETLEHVGQVPNGVQNVIGRIAPGGQGLISVPIEHGKRGIAKYFIKKMIGGYTTAELGISEASYRKALFSSGRLSKTRPKADGFGTHFGFDFRDVDDCLQEFGVNFSAFNSGMTRFYRIQG